MENPKISSFYKQTTLSGVGTKEEPPLSLPQHIGPYKIEGLLSRGGMSLLYLGIHPETRAPLAIKVLSPQFVTHQESIERFLKEAHIIALTNHPNIVKLYGQGEWEGGLYIAMELIQGVSLRQFISQHSLSLKRSIDILLQVAYALLHLHTHGVIHRDLKPENILITEEGEVKVIDFGIAQLHEETPSTPSSSIMGTPDYMSPEQKENPALVSYSSDIYSLGVIAYELILGKLSYGVIHLSLLPQGLQKILKKALAISPKERYQDIVDCISDFSHYIKSGDWEKDRSGNDQLKELLEIVQKTTSSLSPSSAPLWPQMDLGLAKYKALSQTHIYVDFFKLPKNTYLAWMAHSPSLDIDSGIFLGMFRGILRSLLHPFLSASKEPFSCKEFATTVNELLASDPLKIPLNLSLLLLDPFNDQLSFLSSGLSSLFLLETKGQTVKELEMENPSLGKNGAATFASIETNWREGDFLLLPSFKEPAIHPLLKEILLEVRLLSAQRQAENLLKKLLSSAAFSSTTHAKTVLSIQRLS